ncbi:putative reverse transcriptase domain-containing protein [Tanacetum coccineum]
MAQVHANTGLSSELLGADVNDDNFAERMVALINQRKRAFAEQTDKEKRDKPMTPAQQREYMRVFVKNQSTTIYSTGWSMKYVKLLTDEQLIAEFEKIRMQKSTEATIPSVPDVPQPPVVSSPKSSSTRRKSLGRSRITKPRSILTELDLDPDDKTFIKVVSDEDSEDKAPILWSAFAGVDGFSSRWKGFFGLESSISLVDLKLEALMERMLTHKLDNDKDVVGNDMTTAEQLIRFIKNQLAAAQAVKIYLEWDPTRLDPKREIGYGITDTWDEMVKDMQGTPVATDVAGLSQRMTDFVMTLNMLRRDKRAHTRTARLMETEARLCHKAWVQSIDASDTTRSEVRALRTTVLAQQTKIGDLQAADHKRQTQLIEKKIAPKRTTRSTPATTTTTTTLVTDAQLKALINQGVADELAVRDADKSQNDEDNHDSGTGVRRQAPPARECTYPDFMKCKPLYFKGTKGFIELTQWFERMEIMFRIRNCTVKNQIKFATCTPLGSDLTWWNSHVRTVGHDVAYAMTWTNLKKKMTDKYCPRGEIKKLEVEMMFPEESDKIEKYVGGLPDMIHGNADNKREFDDTSKNNQNQQQPPKRQNVARAYTARFGEKKPYGGSKPLYLKCNYHHEGQCAPKCHKCNRIGHLARDCRSPTNANNNNNQRAPKANPGVLTCFECGAQGHFKKDCPKSKNRNQGNRAGVGNVVARAYAVGAAGTNLNANVVTGTFLLNNHYASILFNTGVDRSFVSTAFSSLNDIIPITLDYGVDIELADSRIIRVNTLIRGCPLNFLNHPFNIDLLPVEMGSFDVIIDMDWLLKYGTDI